METPVSTGRRNDGTLFKKPNSTGRPIFGINKSVDSSNMERKASRITEMFDLGLLVESSPQRSSSYDGDESSTFDSPSRSWLRSKEEFDQRVASFQAGSWTIHQLSPLECASWGWKLIEKDVLQCVSCHEVICASLPNQKDKQAYMKFFDILKSRIELSHKDSCGWLCNPCPKEYMEPLAVGFEELRNMKNSVQTLIALHSALPFLNNTRLTAVLGADDEVIKGMLKKDDIDEDAKISAVLLVLSGWHKGQGAFLKCNVCKRLVGLWSLINIADELKKSSSESSKASSEASSRKRKLSEQENVQEEDSSDNIRITRRSPRISKSQDSETPTPKRMKTRSRGEETESENHKTPEKENEKQECLLITSPSSQVEKVEKRYFKPLEEHRHWCPWITEVEALSEEDEVDPPKGFCLVTEQVRTLLEASVRRRTLSWDRCANTVDGLRIIRNLLDEVSED